VRVTHTGTWIVYYEGDDQPYLQDLGLKVLDPADAVVPLRTYQGLEPPYTPAGTGRATAVASFFAKLVGTYQVSASPYDLAARSPVGEDLNAYQVAALPTLAIGDDLNKVIAAGILKAKVAGLAIVIAAAAIALVTSMRRAGC